MSCFLAELLSTKEVVPLKAVYSVVRVSPRFVETLGALPQFNPAH